MSNVSNKETDFNEYLDSSLSVEVRLESLKQAIISNEGLNLEYVSHLEKISPGCILDNKPRSLIIHEPNPSNLEYAVESIDRLKTALAVGVIGAIIMMIIKFFSRFGSGSEGGGGGGGYNNLKDPTQTFDNLAEKDEKVRRQIEENVEKLKDTISSEVMLKANIKSDTKHLLKRCGLSEEEMERLIKNEHELQRYLLNPDKLLKEIFWHNGGDKLPGYLTSPHWASTLNLLDHLVSEVDKVTKARWDFAEQAMRYFHQMYNEMDDTFRVFYKQDATNPHHSAAHDPRLKEHIRIWKYHLSMEELFPKEPHVDLEAIKHLSKQYPIPGYEVNTNFTVDADRSTVLAYLLEFVSRLREPGADNRSAMPNYLEFSKRLDRLARITFKGQAVIIDLSKKFEMMGKGLQDILVKIQTDMAARNEIPIEVRNEVETYRKYAHAQFDIIGKILAAFMNIHNAFETTANSYREIIEALEIANTDLDNLQKRMSKARDEIEKEKLRNDVHQH